MTATATKPGDVTFDQLANWTPRQWEAVLTADQYQFTLFGGFRGPGKSYWLRWALLRELLKLDGQGIKGARAGLFCESYEVLRDRQIGPIEREFPRDLGEVKQSAIHGLAFHIKAKFGGGVLALRNLDDPQKYIGAEFCAVGVDQIEKNPIEVFDALRGNLRWPGVEKPLFMATANPGVGIGLPWVKALWVDREPEDRLRALLPEVALVPGRPGDNPHLPQSYWEMLKTQPEHIRRAWLEGDWSVIEGAAFPEWQGRKDGGPWHIIPTGVVPGGQTYYVGADWGFSDPCAIHLLTLAHDGRVMVCREIYVTRRRTSELGELILRMIWEAQVPQNTFVYVGFDVFNRRLNGRGEYDEPIVQTWQQQGLQCVSSGRDPMFRASKMREYLSDWGADEGWPKGRPGLQVMECCRNLIRTLPLLQLDKNKPEQVNTEMEDHCYDSVGHVLTSMPGRPEKRDEILDMPPRAQIMERAMQARREAAENQRDMVHGIDEARGWGGEK